MDDIKDLSTNFKHNVRVYNSVAIKEEDDVHKSNEVVVENNRYGHENNKHVVYCQEELMEQTHKQLCMASALRQNATTIHCEVPPFRDELIDLLIEKNVLYKDEIPYLNDTDNQSAIGKVRTLLKQIRGRSYHCMDRFLQCMKQFHPHMVNMIHKSFEECMKETEIKLTCSFCFLKTSFDIKTVAEVTWTAGNISDSLYEFITDYREPSDELWQRFAKECNAKDCKTIKLIITKIQIELETRGQYCELVAHVRSMRSFICECDKIEKHFRKRFSERRPSHQGDRQYESTLDMCKAECLQNAFSNNELLLVDNITLVLRERQTRV